MADCFITRRGGGGSGGLNFEVVDGTTQPTSPKENTIWVNTGTVAITSWVFSVDEPESPAAGMVWFKTGANDVLAFNALKKNEIDVRPLGAYQYIDGSFTKKDILMYRNGKWQDTTEYLYNNGVLNNGTELEIEAKDGSTELIYADSHINFKASGGGYLYTYFANKVDLTNYKKVKLNARANTSYTASDSADWAQAFRLYASTTISYAHGAARAMKGSTTAGESFSLELDVSSLNGEFYILMLAKTVYGGDSVDIDVSEVYLVE